MTYGASTTTDHPLAAELAKDAAHMVKVRYQYELTKTRHAGQDRPPRAPRDRTKTPKGPKVRCKHGHKMTPENTYTHTSATGQARRRCRQCCNDSDKARRAKKAATE